MSYEVDYIPVDSGDKSGDAIVLRFGNFNGSRDEQTIIVIDGGFQEAGELLVQHIKDYYKTSSIDLAISTHPDNDHISGLRVVVENLNVGQLVMHKPWEHAEYIKDFFKTKSLTVSGLEDKIEKSIQAATNLEELAASKGIQIVEPFQGASGLGGALHILGPDIDYYRGLLANFRSTPEPINALADLMSSQKFAGSSEKTTPDHWHLDLLNDDEDTTSAENNTSTIILFNIEGHRLLFTGDAGKTAMFMALDYATAQGISLNGINFLDIPHHGSKHNINSNIIKALSPKTAFISASKHSKKHPSKRVTNGLQKHGSKVFVTRGNKLRHHNGGLDRGWNNATEEPFHNLVED